MNKLTKDLLKIFRPEGEFRQGDVVAYGTSRTKFNGQFISQDEFYMYIMNSDELAPCEVAQDLFLALIEPMVTLSEVLMKFNELRKFHTTLDITNKGYMTFSNDSKSIHNQWDWQLGKGLFQQTKETQELIYRILK